MSIWLAFCGFMAWRYTGHAGAAIITFVVVTAPLLLWVRHQSKKQAQSRDAASK